ncbi:hypothetical protein ACLVWU_12860 [Bdellovibrio sp. HCB290]|uniref:hypothetical protein n=1 Tax=Bdellovibrio sp. HCB290 TaxID=3394356 RepID=UPI0039B5F1B9
MKKILSLTVLSSLVSLSAFAGGPWYPVNAQVIRYDDGAILCSVTKMMGVEEEILFRCPTALNLNVAARFSSQPVMHIENGKANYYATIHTAGLFNNGSRVSTFDSVNGDKLSTEMTLTTDQGIVTVIITPQFGPREIQL